MAWTAVNQLTAGGMSAEVWRRQLRVWSGWLLVGGALAVGHGRVAPGGLGVGSISRLVPVTGSQGKLETAVPEMATASEGRDGGRVSGGWSIRYSNSRLPFVCPKKPLT